MSESGSLDGEISLLYRFQSLHDLVPALLRLGHLAPSEHVVGDDQLHTFYVPFHRLALVARVTELFNHVRFRLERIRELGHDEHDVLRHVEIDVALLARYG